MKSEIIKKVFHHVMLRADVYNDELYINKFPVGYVVIMSDDPNLEVMCVGYDGNSPFRGMSAIIEKKDQRSMEDET